MLLLCAMAPPAAATLYLWRGLSSGNPGADGHTYDLPANWSPSGLPFGSSDYVRFDLIAADSPPLQLTTARPIGTFEVAGTSVSLINDPPLGPGSVLVGGATGPGTLTLLSGTLAGSFTQWRIGNSSTGTVVVTGTAAVQAGDAQIGIGSQGTLTVDGPGASWTHTTAQLTLGSGAIVGVVNVKNGGTLTTAGGNGNRAQITVNGSGSTWIDTGNFTTNDGPTISGGAHAESQTLHVYNPNSGLASIVTGPGSQWLMHAQAEIERPGIAVENGGLLTTQAGLVVDKFGFATVDGAGSRWNAQGIILLLGTSFLIVQNHGMLNSSGSVFLNIADRAIANVSSGAEWHYSGAINVRGGSGFTSSIAVSGGGLLEGPGIGFANNQGVGKVQVSDVGSRWHVTGDQTVGGSAATENSPVAFVDVGGGGEMDCDGTVTLNYGGNLTIGSGGLLKTDQLDLEPLSSGAFLFSSIDGTIRTNRLTLGGFHPLITFGTVQLGHAEGLGSGLLTVAFGSSVFTDHGVFGYDAPASVTVSGTLNGTTMVVGDQAAGDGTFLIGVGANSSTTKDLTVGEQGHGLFQVGSGNEHVGRHLMIAAETGSVGTVTVGNGTLTVAGDVFLGGSRAGAGGAGMLKHTGTGSTTITDTLFVFPSDTLLVPTGQLSASVIDLMGGVLKSRTHITGKIINAGFVCCAPDTFRFTALTLTGDLEQQAIGILNLRVPSLARHDSLVVSGVMTMAGTLALDMDPSLTPHAGDRVRLATAGSFAGQFQSVTGVPAATAVAHWSLVVQSGSLYLLGVQSTGPALPMTSGLTTALLAMAMLGIGAASLRRGDGRRGEVG
jgi:T5SS/PEP-CTERM-associated repeat protein